MVEIWAYIATNASWDDILTAIGAASTLAAIIARLTPNKSDDRWVDAAIGFLNKLALNPSKGKARS